MNWKILIAECIAKGLSQAEIARQIGVTQSAISHIVKGSQKGFLYEPGKKLIDLHARLYGAARPGPIDRLKSTDDTQPPVGTSSRKPRKT